MLRGYSFHGDNLIPRLFENSPPKNEYISWQLKTAYTYLSVVDEGVKLKGAVSYFGERLFAASGMRV